MAEHIDDGLTHVDGVRSVNFIGGPQVTRLSEDAVQVLIPVMTGTVAPNAGAGVAHIMPALYVRNNAGTTELWVANGTGPTAWIQVTIP